MHMQVPEIYCNCLQVQKMMSLVHQVKVRFWKGKSSILQQMRPRSR